MRTAAALAVALLACAALPACTDGGPTGGHTAVIASMREPCIGAGDLLCLRVSLDGGPVERFYDQIDGFTFQWGARTELRLTIDDVEDPVPDGPSKIYTAETVLAEDRDPPGTQYTLSFHGSDGWYGRVGDHLAVGNTEFACAPALCDQILAGESEAHDIAFELTTDPFVPLRALAITAPPG